MILAIVFTRPGCHLCEDAINLLSSMQKEFPIEIQEINIDDHPDVRERYSETIPVVQIDSFVLKAPISENELRIALQKAQQNQQSSDLAMRQTTREASGHKANWTGADRFSYFLARHYLGLINLVVFLFLLFPFLAPVFMKIGWELPASVIYRVYGTTCHQLAFRSFFLFGEQVYYPREAAHIEGVLTFQGASGQSEGNSPDEIWAARSFVGNEQIGYKIAICQRDLFIYSGILIFNIIFALTKRRIRPLTWYWWIIIGILPVGIDGLSQLLSQPPLGFFAFRESTPLLRMLTGFLFGFTTAWFGIPHVEASMRESLEASEEKMNRLGIS